MPELLVKGAAEAGSGKMRWESAKGGCGEGSPRRVEKFSQRQEMRDRAWVEGMEGGRERQKVDVKYADSLGQELRVDPG